jgi:signal transduction histidine kinase
MKTKQSGKKKIGAFHWAIWFYIFVIISSVMAFGTIVFFVYDMDRHNSIYMLAMIPLMGMSVGAMIYKIIKTLKIRMGKILDGITKVAQGDLDVEIDINNAGEYEVIYSNFNKMVKELRNTKIEMQNFVNDFSHEFKTPITSIQGFAELLLDTEVNEQDRKQYLQIIAEESARLSELSQNTLLLSKLEAQQVVIDKREFYLDEQIKKCAIVLFRELEKKQITLNMELPKVKYYGNPELIQQIWMNLISNAIKFTPQKGEITIIIVAKEKHIIVDISDSGIGMEEETIKHIFVKYYQGDASHATRGYGLGLSIVERIVTLCGGKITVTSVPGSGSTFTTTLPITRY